MNRDEITLKNQTKDFLLSLTKNCQKLDNQTQRKPRETLEFKFIRARENLLLKPSIVLGLDSKLMIGLTNLEVKNFIFLQ